jgi:hypothetical protein
MRFFNLAKKTHGLRYCFDNSWRRSKLAIHILVDTIHFLLFTTFVMVGVVNCGKEALCKV